MRYPEGIGSSGSRVALGCADALEAAAGSASGGGAVIGGGGAGEPSPATSRMPARIRLAPTATGSDGFPMR